MNLIKITLLSGSALALLLPLVPQQAAFAQSTNRSEPLTISQTMTTGTMVAGRVVDIVGLVVSVDLDNGRHEKVVLSHQELGELGLVPGMRVALNYDGNRVTRVMREEVTLTQAPSSDLLDRVRRARMELENRPTRQVEVQRPVVIEQRTTTPPPAPMPMAPVPQVRQQPAQPIRALW